MVERARPQCCMTVTESHSRLRDEHVRIVNKNHLGQEGQAQSTERMFLPARTMAASRCSGEGVFNALSIALASKQFVRAFRLAVQ